MTAQCFQSVQILSFTGFQNLLDALPVCISGLFLLWYHLGSSPKVSTSHTDKGRYLDIHSVSSQARHLSVCIWGTITNKNQCSFSLRINTGAGVSEAYFERVQKHCRAGCQQNKIPTIYLRKICTRLHPRCFFCCLWHSPL